MPSARSVMSRHRIVLRDNLQGITRAALRRVMRKAGIKRVSSMTYETARYTLKAFMEKLIHDTVMYTEYAHRKTVTVRDVIAGAKRNRMTLYAYDYENGPIDYRASADYNELVSDEPEVASMATPISSVDNGLPVDDYMNTAEAAVSIPPSSMFGDLSIVAGPTPLPTYNPVSPQTADTHTWTTPDSGHSVEF